MGSLGRLTRPALIACVTFALLTALTAFAASGDTVADRVFGQPNFTSNIANNGGLSASSLSQPSGAAMDGAGHLYVADAANNRVLEYDSPLTSRLANRVFGQPDFTTNDINHGGVSASSLNNPFGVALDGAGHLYVADAANHRVLEYDSPLSSQSATRVFGQGGSFTTNTANNGGIGTGSLSSPGAVALDGAGRLFVSDQDNSRVLEYDSPLTSQSANRVFGQAGSFATSACNGGGLSASALCLPGAVALDTAGRLYVADLWNSRVLEYDSPLTSQSASRVFGQAGSFTTAVINNGGVSASSLNFAFGVMVDAGGRLYIGDTQNNRVLEYDSPLTSQVANRVFGQPNFTSNTANNGGVGPSTLSFPAVLATGGGGDLYVVDAFNHRVLSYGTWFSAASMATARSGHTASLLSNGKVVVAGGFSGPGSTLASAELYDPATNAWSAAASMATARGGHTATLLSNGKLLVVGGWNNLALLASAELYDPATNAWSAASNMATARSGHTATLLSNGKVLVAGGWNGGVPLASAELFDPATNTWSAAVGMATARSSHTATRLSSGKVLIAGGDGGGVLNYLASAVLYDVTTNTWSLAANMVSARRSHSATLLPNGNILVSGGETPIGGGFYVYSQSSELYNPAANTWSTAASMTTGRSGHTATLLPGSRVLVTGSYSYLRSPATELYDAATDTWSAAGSMAVGRGGHTATLLQDGRVLAAGDWNNGVPLSSAELYGSQLAPVSVGGIAEQPDVTALPSRTTDSSDRARTLALIAGATLTMVTALCVHTWHMHRKRDASPR